MCNIKYDDDDFISTVHLEQDAAKLFLNYIGLELEKCENFVDINNESSKYYFIYVLICGIASCLKYLEKEVNNKTESINYRKFTTFKISHEHSIKVENCKANGPVEFLTLGLLCNILKKQQKDITGIFNNLDGETKSANFVSNNNTSVLCNDKDDKKLELLTGIDNNLVKNEIDYDIYESIFEVKKNVDFIKENGKKITNAVYQFFSQLCVALEHNVAQSNAYPHVVYGAYTDCDAWYFAKIKSNDATTSSSISNLNKYDITVSKRKLFQIIDTQDRKIFVQGSHEVMEYLFSMLFNGRELNINKDLMQNMIESYKLKTTQSLEIKMTNMYIIQEKNEKIQTLEKDNFKLKNEKLNVEEKNKNLENEKLNLENEKLNVEEKNKKLENSINKIIEINEEIKLANKNIIEHQNNPIKKRKYEEELVEAERAIEKIKNDLK